MMILYPHAVSPSVRELLRCLNDLRVATGALFAPTLRAVPGPRYLSVHRSTSVRIHLLTDFVRSRSHPSLRRTDDFEVPFSRAALLNSVQCR